MIGKIFKKKNNCTDTAQLILETEKIVSNIQAYSESFLYQFKTSENINSDSINAINKELEKTRKKLSMLYLNLVSKIDW